MPNDITPCSQQDIFLDSAADAYFDRNFSHKREQDRVENDYIVALHQHLRLAPPQRMLEIGCMTGYRCEAFRLTFGSKSYGVEPSAKAINLGRTLYPKVQLEVGAVTDLPWKGQNFDCIVLGNFLFWVDREILFCAAHAIDSALANNGILYLLDFDPSIPHKNIYSHHKDCKTYKMHHYKMFTWNPQYYIIYQSYCDFLQYNFSISRDDCSKITILRKDTQSAYNNIPYSKLDKDNKY